MKKFIVPFSILLFSIQFAVSQTVVVIDETDRVEGKEVPGISIVLENVDVKEVEKFWTNQLKSYGRMAEKDGFLIVSEAQIPKIAGNNPARSFSIITLSKGGQKIWWGIEFAGKFISGEEYQSKLGEARQILHQFGVDMYVNEVNKEIAEAERVIQIEVKNYESLVKSSENFSEEFERNHLQKIRLEERLVQNRIDSVNIVNLIGQNKIDQKLTLEEIEQLKAAKESIKGKLEGIK